MNLRFTADAAAEYHAAWAWYEMRQTGRGDDFDAEVDEALRWIQKSPTSAPRDRSVGRRHDVRLKKVDRYPYLLVYEIRQTELILIAVAHVRRRTGYWRRRLS